VSFAVSFADHSALGRYWALMLHRDAKVRVDAFVYFFPCLYFQSVKIFKINYNFDLICVQCHRTGEAIRFGSAPYSAVERGANVSNEPNHCHGRAKSGV